MFDSLRTTSLVKFLLVIVPFLCRVYESCPDECWCKWKNGKQTVGCTNKDLLIIPDGMDSTTQVLEFCGNNLHTLQNEKFLRIDLINLQRIYLCRCGISTIEERTFRGLTNLVELDLSLNALTTIPTPVFRDCISLMRLNLNTNPIRTVAKGAFQYLPHLTVLELSNCELGTIEVGAFDGLPSLEWLHLNGNRLTKLPGAGYLPPSLRGIQLEENPWICDCHILELHSWLRSFQIGRNAREATCTSPERLISRTIESVSLNELACLPDVSPTHFYLEIGEGRNVSLLCQVRDAIPEAKITWRFRGQLLVNDTYVAPGVHVIFSIENGTSSELFIYNTNTDDNGTFVCHAENPAGSVQANFTIRVTVNPATVSGVVVAAESAATVKFPMEFVIVTVSISVLSVLLLVFIVVLTVLRCQRSWRLNRKRHNSKVQVVVLSNSTTKDNHLLQENSNTISSSLVDDLVSEAAEPEEPELSSEPLPIVFDAVEQDTDPDLITGTTVPTLVPVNCYKTLPYKRHTAARPINRYAMEAEFLCRHPPTVSYEFFNPAPSDVRYTVDGYPETADQCCSFVRTAPAHCHTFRRPVTVKKKCATIGAQTQTDDNVFISSDFRRSEKNPAVIVSLDGKDQDRSTLAGPDKDAAC